MNAYDLVKNIDILIENLVGFLPTDDYVVYDSYLGGYLSYSELVKEVGESVFTLQCRAVRDGIDTYCDEELLYCVFQDQLAEDITADDAIEVLVAIS